MGIEAYELARPANYRSTRTTQPKPDQRANQSCVSPTRFIASTRSSAAARSNAETNGFPVITIEFQAFYRCESVTSVTIPDSVTRIERFAFT